MALVPNHSEIHCPHCFGKIDLAAAAQRFPYPLSIICLTRGGEEAGYFIDALRASADLLGAELIVGLDGGKVRWTGEKKMRVIPIHSNGYVESALNQLARHAQGQFILRLDDDETISPAMLQWLRERRYMGQAAWAFPTAALWGNDDRFIVSPPFWPDTHVRLTAWHLAADWPDEPHGKPAWVKQAALAPVAIRHHKFLVKSYEERRRIADQYEAKLAGGGHGRRMIYNCPEDVVDELSISWTEDGPYTKHAAPSQVVPISRSE